MAEIVGTQAVVAAATACVGTVLTSLLAGTPYVDSVAFIAPSGNSGVVYYGSASATNSTNAAGIVPAGGGVSYQAQPGNHVNLDRLYFYGTANDLLYISVLR